MYENPPAPWFWNCEGSSCALLASMVKFPPGGQKKDVPYAELVCTEEDQKFIRELIETLGEEGKIALLFKATYMKRLGALICHVHPIKFLAVIFRDTYLGQCVSMIMDDGFKRAEFMDGLGSGLTREVEKGTLETYLVDFQQEVGGTTKLDEIQAICKTRNWEKLIYYLLEHV